TNIHPFSIYHFILTRVMGGAGVYPILCDRCLLVLQVPTVPRRTVASVQVTIQGENASLGKKTKVLVEPPAFIHVVQTDKPIYKPGQTVQFRIVSLDDPNSNRIAQWLDRALVSGILDLSHPMIPEAVQGTYMITALTDKGEEISHSFEIKEYVLPKFEVNVKLPSVITILDEEATLRVCGKYTYGKPVIGSVKAEFCRRTIRYCIPNVNKISLAVMTTDKSGCATQTVNLTAFALDKTMYADNFQVSFMLLAALVPHGATFNSHIRTVSFEDVPAAYRPGIPFEGKVISLMNDQSAVINTETVKMNGNDKHHGNTAARLVLCVTLREVGL
uniref:Macroglobulin domain-containing protein n=1 Tax=Acanthochromis polyacanthus TaxID=80966 RepID=A0A3Q1GNN3_9TELE